MKWKARIDECLADPSARLMCIDPTGGRLLPLSHALGLHEDRRLDTAGPLDLFPSESRSDIVKGFALAKMQGTSAVDTALKTGEIKRFTFFDEEKALGCVVAVMSSVPDDAASAGLDDLDLPVRTTSYTLDTVGNIVDVHVDFERMLGWSPIELIGQPALDIIHPDDHEKGIVGWIELLERGLGGQSRVRQRFLTKEGAWRWLEDTSTNRLDDPEHAVVLSELVDISEEMAALEEAERRDALLTRLTDALPSGVLHVGSDRMPIFWNQRWVELLEGQSPTLDGLLEQIDERSEVADAIDLAYREGADADLDVTLTGGQDRFGRLHVRPLEHADGTAELMITMDDTTAARTYQQVLHDLAHRDALTGLLGRLGLRPAVEQLLASTEETKALLFIDLDTFKPINDTYGHAVGDDVLRAVGRAIDSATRPGDQAARIGGDEFVVVVGGATSKRALDDLVDRIHEALAEAVAEVAAPIQLSASIGVAEARNDDTYDSLLQRADHAMYDVKRGRRHERAPADVITSRLHRGEGR